MSSIRILLPLFALSALAADPDGAALFKAKCATCHVDQPDGRTPARSELARLTPELVVNEMVNGKMKLQATGLSSDEMKALASFLTGKAPSAVTTTNTCSDK